MYTSKVHSTWNDSLQELERCNADQLEKLVELEELVEGQRTRESLLLKQVDSKWLPTTVTS
jgi:hypothetical protein